MRIKQVKRSYISSFKATVSLVSGVIYSGLCSKTSAEFKEASLSDQLRASPVMEFNQLHRDLLFLGTVVSIIKTHSAAPWLHRAD